MFEKKRENFRVYGKLPFALRPKSAAGGGAPSASSGDLTAELASLEGKDVDPALTYVLRVLDDKLNAIMSHLSNEEGGGGMAVPDMKELNISAGGLSFLSDAPYDVGEVFELLIGLPPMPYTMMTMHGEVVRANERNLDGKTCYEVAVKFLHLDEDDRKGLVKYLFDVQRKDLK